MRTLLKLLLVAGLLLAQKAENLLQSGIKKETVDGNLRGAIEDYKRAAAEAKGDRSLAARALFQLAQCYRKLGDAQAKQTLERIVREFGDQPFAAQARTQLASIGDRPATASNGVQLRKLYATGDYGCSSVSADGSLLGCARRWVDEAAVFETATGRFRDLTQLRKETPANRLINTFAISPDGKWMAFHLYRAGAVQNEIAIIPTDGSGSMRTVYRHPDGRWLDVHAWTPDSRSILITVSRSATEKAVLGYVPVRDGTFRSLRQLDFNLQWAPLAFSPDGRWLAVSVPVQTRQASDVEIWNAADGSTVSSVLKTDAHDQVTGWSPDGKSLLVATNSSRPASLLRYRIEDGKPVGAPQTVRSDNGAYQDSKGIDQKGRIYLSVAREQSGFFSVGFDQEKGALTGPESVLSSRTLDKQAFGAWSPDGSRLASWTYESFNNSAMSQPAVVVRNLKNGSETITKVDRGFFTYHMPTWDPDGRSLLMWVLEKKPDEFRLMRLDPLTGKTEPASGVIRASDNIGRTPDWTPDGRFLFLIRESGIVRVDTQTGTETPVLQLAKEKRVRALCVSPDGKKLAYFSTRRSYLPDGQFTSVARFIEILDLASGTAQSIPDSREGGWGASTIAWTPNGKFLVYGTFDKKEPGVWILPADGSAPPRALMDQLDSRTIHLAFSPDGKTMSFVRGTDSHELWMLEGFLEEAQ